MWAQILNMILGLWLMAAPDIIGYSGRAADNDNIIGPVIASFSIIALSGCTRSISMYNLPLGIWLFLAPWFLGYEDRSATFNDMAVGFLITGFSFFKRKTNKQYGGGWSALWKQRTQLD
jgi:hypothetical protein